MKESFNNPYVHTIKYFTNMMDKCNNDVIDRKENTSLEHKHQHQLMQLLNDTEVESLEPRAPSHKKEKMGQAESKNNQNNHNVCKVQTKGTAMSFGFRKYLKTTPKHMKTLLKGDNTKKKKNACKKSVVDTNATKETDNRNQTPDNIRRNDPKAVKYDDNNGNTEHLSHCDKKSNDAVSVTPNSRQMSKKNNHLPGVSNRFGFRGSLQKQTIDQRDTNDNVKNNNSSKHNNKKDEDSLNDNYKSSSNSVNSEQTPIKLKSVLTGESSTFHNAQSKSKTFDLKPNSINESGKNQSIVVKNGNITNNDERKPEERIKARTAQPKTLTFDLKQNTSFEYGRYQSIKQPSILIKNGNFPNKYNSSNNSIFTDISNNVIEQPAVKVRPTATAHKKYTLQTVNLPRPEFAVAINISSNNPVTSRTPLFISTSASSTDLEAQINNYKEEHSLVKNTQSTTPLKDSRLTKHKENSIRRTFCGNREISADSGIGATDMNTDSFSSKSDSSTTTNRAHSRNLQMVMNGRGRFHIQDMDMTSTNSDEVIAESSHIRNISSDCNSTPLNKNSFNLEHNSIHKDKNYTGNLSSQYNLENDYETVEEEKLSLDRWNTEKKHKEYLYVERDICDTKNIQCTKFGKLKSKKSQAHNAESTHDKTQSLTTISSFVQMDQQNLIGIEKCHQEKSESVRNGDKTALIKDFGFLDDNESSPTESSFESMACKQKKHKMNEKLQETDSGANSTHLETTDPQSPGTPTHSLSSECGNLIDDEIADQPALLFNMNSHGGGVDRSNSPSLMETLSLYNGSTKGQLTREKHFNNQMKKLGLRTPLSERKSPPDRANSLDTFSPCESICSGDLILDFDIASSTDSLARPDSVERNSGSECDNVRNLCEDELNNLDFIGESTSLLDEPINMYNSSNLSAHLLDYSTQLLSPSRMEKNNTINNILEKTSKNSTNGQRNSPATVKNIRNNRKNSDNATFKHNNEQKRINQNSQIFEKSSMHKCFSDEITLYDNAFQNSMAQDVLQLKKQLLRVRQILQEAEPHNPFDHDKARNVSSCGYEKQLKDEINSVSITPFATSDLLGELTNLGRQVIYLQSQVDDHNRTIRLQKLLIEEIEAEKRNAQTKKMAEVKVKECVTSATQTEKIRTLAISSNDL